MGLSAKANSLTSPASDMLTAGPGSQQMTALSVAIVTVPTLSSVRADTGMNIKCRITKYCSELTRIRCKQIACDERYEEAARAHLAGYPRARPPPHVHWDALPRLPVVEAGARLGQQSWPWPPLSWPASWLALPSASPLPPPELPFLPPAAALHVQHNTALKNTFGYCNAYFAAERNAWETFTDPVMRLISERTHAGWTLVKNASKKNALRFDQHRGDRQPSLGLYKILKWVKIVPNLAASSLGSKFV